MKLLIRLEKNKSFWFLLLISFIFFLLRLPSLIEPNWYGDEGIYQVIGMAVNSGSILYSGIWDNKPPLLYLTHALFNGDQFGVRLTSLFVGLFSVWGFFYLSKKLFEKIKITIITTTFFAVFFAIPLIEGNIANAENFMLLPIIVAAFFIYKTKDTKYLIATGLLLGIAFLFKIVAIFDLAAFLVFVFITNFPVEKLKSGDKWKLEKGKLLYILHTTYYILLGFIVPLLIAISYFALNNALPDFLRATFFGNVGYVGYANKFIIPQGLLILKFLLLAGFVLLITVKREKISKASIFVLIWLAFSLFNALFSQRPYTHYVLVLLPSFCLLIGLILSERKINLKKFFVFILIIFIAVLFTTFKFYNLKKTILYYQNALLFVTGKKDVNSYQMFFDKKTPRDYQLASFIKIHTNKNDHIFIWGDSAQIYALSKTLPINKYTVAYHIVQNKQAIIQTQKDLDVKKPKYVIVLPESRVLLFKLTGYTNKFYLSGSTIYERSL